MMLFWLWVIERYFYYMLEALFGQDLDEFERENPDILATLIPNASIARFAYDNGKWILEELPKWLIACY